MPPMTGWLVLEMKTPVTLPEMTLPAPAGVSPPITVPGALPTLMPTEFPLASVPVMSVPMNCLR